MPYKDTKYPFRDTLPISQNSRRGFSQEQAALMQEEVESLLQKGAISLCPNTLEGFYSTLFLVPKKNGQMRPVISLKQLNKWVEIPHFKMECTQ